MISHWSFLNWTFLGPIDYTASVSSSQWSQSIPSATLQDQYGSVDQGSDQNRVVSSFNWNVFPFHGSPNIKGIWILYLPRTGPFISDHGTSRKIILLPSILYPILSHCTPIISHDTPHPGPIVWWLKSSPIPHHGCHPRRSACSSSGGRGPASYQHAFISVCVCISVDHVYIYYTMYICIHIYIYLGIYHIYVYIYILIYNIYVYIYR